MPVNEMDELLRGRFEAHQPEYNPAAWEQLAAKLPVSIAGSKRRIWPLMLGIAASLTAVCFIFVNKQQTHESAATEVAAKQARGGGEVKPVKDAASTTAAATAQMIPVNARIAGAPKSAQQSYKTIVTAVPDVRIASDDTVVKSASVAVTPQARGNTGYSKPATSYLTVAELPEPLQKPEARTIISLGGGINYGSLNTGYAASVSVQRSISKRMYLETEVGYLNYSSFGGQLGSTANKGATFQQGISANTIPQEPAARPVIQYVQAAPGIGYHLTRGISIGAGLDLQRAIDSRDFSEMRVGDDGTKTLPLLDMGATGKAEFRIARRLLAGVQYRQGINNVFQNSSQYLDRRYLQVQLKIPLLYKQ